MAKQMKSFRLEQDSIYELQIIAEKFGITQTDAIELAVRWAFESGLVYGLEDAGKELGQISVNERMISATRDGEITCTVRNKLRNA